MIKESAQLSGDSGSTDPKAHARTALSKRRQGGACQEGGLSVSPGRAPRTGELRLDLALAAGAGVHRVAIRADHPVRAGAEIEAAVEIERGAFVLKLRAQAQAAAKIMSTLSAATICAPAMSDRATQRGLFFCRQRIGADCGAADCGTGTRTITRWRIVIEPCAITMPAAVSPPPRAGAGGEAAASRAASKGTGAITDSGSHRQTGLWSRGLNDR